MICSNCGTHPLAGDNGHKNPKNGGFYCSECAPLHHDPETGELCEGCWEEKSE